MFIKNKYVPFTDFLSHFKFPLKFGIILHEFFSFNLKNFLFKKVIVEL